MDTAIRRVRMAALASVYPSDLQPTRGLVAEERLRQLVGSGRVAASVVSPVPWFPFRSERFGRWSVYARTPARERRFGIVIEHPFYMPLPFVGYNLRATLFSRTALAVLLQWQRRRVDFDLIEAHGLYPDGIAATRAAAALRKPCIIVVRGADLERVAQHPSIAAPARVALATAGAVVASSQAVRERLIALGASPATTRVVRNGVDTGRFRMLGHHTVKRKLRLDGAIWLAVGPLVPAKRIELVVAALAHVPDATLLILGEGSAEARLRGTARKFRVANRIHFLGATAHNQLARYYNAADALFDASGALDVPNAVLEALACGTPIVAAPGAGVRDVMDAPAAGEIAATADAAGLAAAWLRLSANFPDRNATRAFAGTLSWEHALDPLGAVYAAVMARAPTPARA